jgi:hypothetical protein
MADDKKIKAVKKEGGKKAQDLAYVSFPSVYNCGGSMFID